MNKKYNEIIEIIKQAKAGNSVLDIISSVSKVSIWGQIIQAVAWCIFNFQEATKLHLANIQFMIENQKNFRLQQYRSEALRFQYGFDLIAETDEFKPTFQQNGVDVIATEEQIEASKIIQYAACSRVINNGRVSIVMKVAPGNLDEMFPDEVMLAFGKYIEEIQPAGDHVTIINYLPDLLRFGFIIKRDPKVLNASGMNIITAEYPVNNAITQFLKEDLPFNAELSVQRLEDAIRSVEGVDDLTTLFVETKWVEPTNPAVNPYGYYQPVNMSVVPQSGRFKIEDFTGLQYI